MKIKRFDIVQADLSGTVGSEQGGVRPVLIIQNDIGNLHSPTTIVIPFSTKVFKNPNQSTHTLIRSSADTGLKEDSILLGGILWHYWTTLNYYVRKRVYHSEKWNKI